MFICKCNIIKPHCILLMYQDITKLVPQPAFIKQRTTLKLQRLSRNTMVCLDDRRNYNKVKFYFTDLLLKKHKEKMQETFYIIKMLSCHDKIDGCNTINYKYVYDTDGNLGICLIYKIPEDEEDEDDHCNYGYDSIYDVNLNNESHERIDSDADTELMGSDTHSEIDSDADTELMDGETDSDADTEKMDSDDEYFKISTNNEFDPVKNTKESINSNYIEYSEYNYDYDYVNKMFDKMLDTIN
jgi:hypothetical protein